MAGAVSGSNAITTDGSTGFLATSQQLPSPTSYSLETWFKTTSTSGGKLIGFGDRQGGYDFNGNAAVSGSYDKQVYMTADGHLKFGVWVGFADTITSGNAYNDGQWHQVVATQSSNGLNLFVDGAKVAHDGQTSNQSYNGYWRVGGDNLGGWPNAGNQFFAGSLDETAVYDHALNLAAVQSHYAASGRTPPPSTVPTDNYGKAVYNDSPANYWRLDETGGASTAADSTDNSTTGNYVGGVTQGAPGALGATGTRGDLRRQHRQRHLDQPDRRPEPVRAGAVVQHHDHQRRQADRLRQRPDRKQRQLRQARLHDQ